MDTFDLNDEAFKNGFIGRFDGYVKFEKIRSRKGHPPRKYIQVKYRTCNGKKTYRDSFDADMMRKRLAERGIVENLRIYQCRFCPGWHLTSKPQHKKRKRRR